MSKYVITSTFCGDFINSTVRRKDLAIGLCNTDIGSHVRTASKNTDPVAMGREVGLV